MVFIQGCGTCRLLSKLDNECMGVYHEGSLPFSLYLKFFLIKLGFFCVFFFTVVVTGNLAFVFELFSVSQIHCLISYHQILTWLLNRCCHVSSGSCLFFSGPLVGGLTALAILTSSCHTLLLHGTPFQPSCTGLTH